MGGPSYVLMKIDLCDEQVDGNALIREFDVSQVEFANDLGISQGQLSRYEQGRSEIGAAVLLRLARRSEKTIEWLLKGRDEISR